MPVAPCIKCRITQVVTSDRGGKPSATRGMCQSCRNRYYRVERQKRDIPSSNTREHRLQTKYGIGEAEFALLWKHQDGKCGCCGKSFYSPPAAKVDHDHETGVIRGLLCFHCNTGIGKLGDDIEGLERAIAYLRGNHAPC